MTQPMPPHPGPELDVRDLSYDNTRWRQRLDLMKFSFFDLGWPDDPDPNSWPTDRFEIYIKEAPRGPGYVADVLYSSPDLPFHVYAVLANDGSGLAIAELELWRMGWQQDQNDGQQEMEQEDEQEAVSSAPIGLGITGELLRRIPVGTILAKAEARLTLRDWESEGITVLMGHDRDSTKLTVTERRALENAAGAGETKRRGRPKLPDELIQEVADLYLLEAQQGRGVLRRLAAHFDRPEPTIRDWISTARKRGILPPATPGRLGASVTAPPTVNSAGSNT